MVTTYKETSQLSASNGITGPQAVGGNGNGGAGAATASATGGAGAAAAGSGSAASSAAHKAHNGSAAALAASASAASGAQDEQLSLSLSLSQGADSAPDKSEASDDGDCNGCGNNNNNNVANNSADNSQALEDDSIESPSRSHRLGASGGLPGLGLGAGSSSGNGRGLLKVESSDVYQIVDALRRNTNLSFDLSCEALRVVLTSLEQLYNGAINPYLEAVAVHVTGKVATPKELLGITHDSKRLQYLFGQLADCKNDTEQRTWMLYEDEEDIIQFLEELVEILVSLYHISIYIYINMYLFCRTTRTRTSAATKCPAISIRCSSIWCNTIRWRAAGPSNAFCSRLSQLPVTWITSLWTFYLPRCCPWRL